MIRPSATSTALSADWTQLHVFQFKIFKKRIEIFKKIQFKIFFQFKIFSDWTQLHFFFNLKYFPTREGLASEFKIALTFLHTLEIKTHCSSAQLLLFIVTFLFIFLYVFTFPPLHCQHKPLLSTSLDPHRTLNIQAEFT